MAEDLDEFGIPIKKKSQPQTSADVDEFGIPIKKKIGLESAVSPSPTSSTEDNTTYGTIPLEDVTVSAKRVNPLLGNNLQSKIPVSRQNELVQEVNKDPNKYLPEKEKGVGERLYNAAKAGIGQLGSIVSSIPSGTIDSYGRMNPTNQGLLGGLGQVADFLKEIKVSDKDGKAYQYFAGVFNALPNGFKATKENLKPTMDASDFGKITEKYTGLPEEYNPLSPNNAAANYFKEVQKKNHEKAQGSYKGGIWQAIKDGKYAEAGKLTATGAVESIPLMLGMAASRGAGLSGNATLAALGVGTAENEYEQLKENNPNIDKNLLLMNAQLTGLGESGSELLGFNMLYDQGKKLFLKGAKEEAENLIKTGLKSYLNTAFKKSFVGSATLSDVAGEMSNQLWKNAIDKWSGIDPERDYTDGVMDAGIISLASTGGIAAGVQGLSKVINPKAKVTIAEDTQKLEQLGSEIENPNLPEEAKNALREEVANTTEKINNTIDKEAKKYDSFSEEDKVKANSLNTAIENLTVSMNDENTSPQAKEIFQKRIDEHEAELAKIKPIEAVKPTEQPTTPKETETPLETIKTPSNEANEQPVPKVENVEEVSTPKTEETNSETRKESVSKEEVGRGTLILFESGISVEDARQLSQDIKDGKINDVELSKRLGKIGINTLSEAKKFLKDGKLSNILDEAIKIKEDNPETIETPQQVAQKEYDAEKNSVEVLKNIRDSEDFKYKTKSSTDVLGNRIEKKVLKTEQELKASTDKINEQIRKGEKKLIDLRDKNSSIEETIAKTGEESVNNFDNNKDYFTDVDDYSKNKKDFTTFFSYDKNGLVDIDSNNLKRAYTSREFGLTKLYNELNFPETLKDQSKINVVKKPKIEIVDGKVKVISKGEIYYGEPKVKPIETISPKEAVTVNNEIKKPEVIDNKTAIPKKNVSLTNDKNNSQTTDKQIETPTENVNNTTEPNVGGEAKVPKEDIQPTKDDGGGNDAKAERVGTTDEKVKALDRLAHQNIESEDLNNTASNQAREKNREFTDEERQYNVQKKMDALRHGDDIVVEAKNAFGDEYVSGLLKYIEDNSKTLTADKKQLMYVTLENDLNRQLLADPENLTLKKQEKLVADKSRAFGRETGRAVAMGALRQLARVGYDATQVTEDFFSPKELTQRRKVEKAVQATPDDINKEYETREESRTDTEIEKAIESGVKKRIDEIYEALPSNRQQRADKAISALERIQKKLRSRTYDASIGLPIAIIDSGISTIKQAIKTGVKVADAIELGIAKIKEKYGKEWKNEDKFRKDMLEGFSEEKIDVEEGSSNTKTDPTVKQALIDAGYSREMTIKNKDGVKEKRPILDWKKLTGEEGSLDNINKVIDLTLADKGYTSEEIENIKQSLKDEYNDLHASIIEKATADLERRNTPRDNSSKILARRLAELYNQGIFDKETDTYDRLINQTLGVSIKDQAMFEEIKGLHKSLADLVDSRDAKGNKLSDVALSTAEAKIKNDIKKVIQKVAFSSGNGAYKATVIIKNLVNGMQRQLLNTIGQLVENPISASYNDMQVKVQDAFKKGQWDTPELKAQRRMLSKAAYKSVLVDKGEEYGGVGSPFTTKNAFDDAIRSVAPNKLYQAYVSAVTGTAFLDSSDSAFKIKRTELEFTHNLLRVLTDKSNPNGAMSQQEALQFVSESLTGQSFADAKNTAKEIIESVNKKAGKEILSPSDTNVIRMANDIVKDALVKGEKITKDLVEDSFKAAYTTAGTGLGHESNNIITKGLGALNRSVETELNDAIKRKEFNKAAMLNMASILTKNVLNPFAGGGANWTIIGMQKMGLPVQYLDPKTYENKRLDLSSVEGLKDAQRALTSKANFQRSNGRTLIAGTTGLIIAAAAYGSGSDDEIKKWRKKHPQLDKYLYKVIPPALALLTNPDQSTKGKVKAVASIIGDRTGGYGDKERMYAIGKDLATNKTKEAAGRTGDLVGSRFSLPYSPIGSSQMSYQVRDLYREFMGLPAIKSNFKNKEGFTKGFFKRGWFDFLGGNDKTKKE